MAESQSKTERLLSLQIDFSAATETMNEAWIIYRNDRSDALALENYTACLERCQEIKTTIYQLKAEVRA